MLNSNGSPYKDIKVWVQSGIARELERAGNGALATKTWLSEKGGGTNKDGLRVPRRQLDHTEPSTGDIYNASV